MRYCYPEDIEDAFMKLGYSKVGRDEAERQLIKEVRGSFLAGDIRVFSKHDVQERRFKLIDKALLDLYEKSGWSMKKISGVLPVSYSVVYNHLHHLGANVRSRGGANHFKHGYFSRKSKQGE